tara:strand:- start:94 stop:813 length:720 start_codon:yes stop_codon:yes gene_type:complete
MTKIKERKAILGLNRVNLKPTENKIKSSLGLEIPYWFWKSDVLKFNKKKSISFLLKKEKEIINKYPSAGDGGTDLANGLTSRYQFYNFLKLKSPALKGLQGHIIKNIKMCINKFNKEGKHIPTNDLWALCWFNVLRKNEKIGQHKHRGLWDAEKSFLSGHLTIQAESTSTHYLSVCENYAWCIENIPGQLIIFPTYVPHYTDTTLSKSPRISVAFDVYDKKDLGEPAFIDRGTCIPIHI